MFLRQITDSSLAQNAYLIGCEASGEAILIDPERDLDRYFQIALENDLRIVAVAETHIHADYLSGARELVERHGLIGYLSAEGGDDWQFEWAKGIANARFLHHGDLFRVGNVEFRALHTPGHTPEHLSFLVTDRGAGADEAIALLSGDFIFVGDVGRPDLLESAAGQEGVMKPSARTLYASLRALGEIPDHVQVLPAHGAGSACGKSLGAVPVSVMGYERKFNGAFREALQATESEFVDHILSGQPEPPLYFARMKRDNKTGPALLPGGKLPIPRRVVSADLGEWIGRSAILDLRGNRAEFALGHLRGALFSPLHGGRLPLVAGSYVEQGTRILLVVEKEEQVDEAVRQLVRIGLDDVQGWIRADEAGLAAEHQAAYPRISPGDLPESAVVLDVRGADEHKARHLRSSKNVAYTRLAARLNDVPKADVLHVHCAGGMRAAIASAYLSSKGMNVVQVDGAFADFPSSMVE